MRVLRLRALHVRDLRNLESVDLEPGPRLNVVYGDNGQGKTNLLEAIYLVATTRSFRGAKTAEMVRRGSGEEAPTAASVRAVFEEDGLRREQSVGVRPGARLVRVDGKRPPSLGVFAAATPVVVFSPAEVELSMGGGAARRKLLDRVALYLFPGSLSELESYQRALRERQRALETRGTSSVDLDDWEELVVRHGSSVTRARREASRSLARSAVEAFSRIGAPGADLFVEYAPSAPEDDAAYRRVLVEKRPADLRRGSASVGPHRDDLRLGLGSMPARGIASQGQHRAIVLALKSAEMAVVGEARGVRPLLLLDDVSSELDRSRTSAFFAFLSGQSGQVFLTTTRPELIEVDLRPMSEGGELRRDFRIVAGRVEPQS